MTITPLLPLLSAAAPAAGAAAVKAVEALGRLGESISFRSLLGEESKPAALETSQATTTEGGLPQKLMGFLTSVGKTLSGALGRAGVDLTKPIDFEIGDGGDVTVGGDHPQRETIAAILARDPQASANLAEALSSIRQDSAPLRLMDHQPLHPQLVNAHQPAGLSAPPAALRLENGRLSIR